MSSPTEEGFLARTARLFKRGHSKSGKDQDQQVVSGRPSPVGELPAREMLLLPVSANVSASLSGPDSGVGVLQACAPGLSLPWDRASPQSWGESISLYEPDTSSTTGRRTGEPIADCFAIVEFADGTGAIMAVADGVGWGDAARRAARCAVLGAMDHLHRQLQVLSGHQQTAAAAAATPSASRTDSPLRTATAVYLPPPRTQQQTSQQQQPLSSTDVFKEMVASLQPAQDLILRQMGTLTTLVLSVVLRQSPSCVHHPHNRSRHAASNAPPLGQQGQQQRGGGGGQRQQQRQGGGSMPEHRMSESGTAGTRSASSSGAGGGRAGRGGGGSGGLHLPEWLRFGGGGGGPGGGAAPQLPTTWVVMTLTVGDSVAWVWRAPPPCTTLAQLQQQDARRHRAASAGGMKQGEREREKERTAGAAGWGGRVQELTAAAHEGQVRDVRFVPGALGYAQGEDADLSNLTLSLTVLKPGDIVFLGSDGVADNFCPVMLKQARHVEHAAMEALGQWDSGRVDSSADGGGGEDKDPAPTPNRPPPLTIAELHERTLELLAQTLHEGAAAPGALPASPSLTPPPPPHQQPRTPSASRFAKGSSTTSHHGASRQDSASVASAPASAEQPTVTPQDLSGPKPLDAKSPASASSAPSASQSRGPPLGPASGLDRMGSGNSGAAVKAWWPPKALWHHLSGGPHSGGAEGGAAGSQSQSGMSALMTHSASRLSVGGASSSGSSTPQLPPQWPLTAQSLVTTLLTHINQATEPLRQATVQAVLEAEAARRQAAAQRSQETRDLGTDRVRTARQKRLASMPPGKLDHATLCAYQVA